MSEDNETQMCYFPKKDTDPVIEEKKKEMRAQIMLLEKKKKTYYILALIIGIAGCVLFFFGASKSLQKNQYDEKTVLFEYEDYVPGKEYDNDTWVRATITSFIPIYSIQNNYVNGKDSGSYESGALYLAEDINGKSFFVLQSLVLEREISSIQNELDNSGVCEIRGKVGAVYLPYELSKEESKEDMVDISSVLYSLGIFSDEEYESVMNNPETFSSSITSCSKRIGTIKLNQSEVNYKVDHISEETSTSVMGKRIMGWAVLILFASIIIVIIGKKYSRKISKIEIEIWDLIHH